MRRQHVLPAAIRLELRCHGGRVLIGVRSMIPAGFSAAASSAIGLRQLFADRGATAQLRHAWPEVGLGGTHGQQLTDSDLRAQLDRAVHAGRLALLWLPGVSPVDQKAVSKYVAAHGANPGAKPPSPHPNAPPAAPHPGPQVNGMSPIAKIEAALAGSLHHVGPELRRALSALSIAGIVHDLAIFFLALAVAQLAGLSAAAVDSALLAYAWYVAGWSGLQAVFMLAKASVAAMHARDERALGAASQMYAQAFILVGEALIAGLLARAQARSMAARAGGRGASAVEGKPATTPPPAKPASAPAAANAPKSPSDLPDFLSKRQDLHVPPVTDGRSVLTADPQKLLDGLRNGEYQVLRQPKPGQMIVDFGQKIGDYWSSASGTPTEIGPTQFGSVMYGKNGVHIVPANPNQW